MTFVFSSIVYIFGLNMYLFENFENNFFKILY